MAKYLARLRDVCDFMSWCSFVAVGLQALYWRTFSRDPEDVHSIAAMFMYACAFVVAVTILDVWLWVMKRIEDDLR